MIFCLCFVCINYLLSVVIISDVVCFRRGMRVALGFLLKGNVIGMELLFYVW